jgi:UDP-glucose 4-epimerase
MDPLALLSACRLSFNAVVHLAAFKAAGESMLKPEKYSLNGTVHILNAMSKTGIRLL